jgi:uncharacterized repeat protein (TIGR01451 family)
MNVFRRFCMAALLVAAFLAIGRCANGQGFSLSVTPSSTALLVSNSLTYTINVTNYNSGGDLQNATVTNILPSSVQVVSATKSQGTVTNYNNVVVFYLGAFIYGPVGAAQLTLTVTPTTAGFITNAVTVSSIYATNTASTNVVVQATNVPPPQVDLGVVINNPVQAVVTNDLTAYTVIVTNAGPAAAPNVALTNTLPSGLILKGASAPYTLSGSNMLFNLGTLAVGGHTNLQISIQPTNVETLTLLASVGASGVLDTNTANNTASNSVDVIAYLPGTLLAVTNSEQTINIQNGLTEQTILLTNIGPNDVDAARVVVTGLANQLFNAVGTNNGSPFVYYSAKLAAGTSVNLRLQYNPRGYFPFTNGQLHAYAVPLPNWTPPKALTTSTNINISQIVQLDDGSMLIEFPSTLGKSYTVVYSDNVLFSNAMIAPPSIVAPANRVQWIDYGPPTTTSEVPNSSVRFYRVFQNP